MTMVFLFDVLTLGGEYDWLFNIHCTDAPTGHGVTSQVTETFPPGMGTDGKMDTGTENDGQVVSRVSTH